MPSRPARPARLPFPARRAVLALVSTAVAVPCAAQGGAPAAPAAPVSLAPPLALSAEPRLVGAGVISRELSEFNPSFTPDGATMVFTVTDAGFTRMTVVEARARGTGWGTPTVLPFSGVWNDGDASLSRDGRRIAFISNRPDSGATPSRTLDLWEAQRGPEGEWQAPRKLAGGINRDDANEAYPSYADDGTLYFGRAGRFYRARRVGEAYGTPEELPFGGAAIAIAPDQRFAVFSAPGAGPGDLDLYLARRDGEGWAPPRRLGGTVGGPSQEIAAWISADANTLYFTSNRRPAGAVTWPRRARVTSYAAVVNELATTFNGLRNIFAVDIREVHGAP